MQGQVNLEPPTPAQAMSAMTSNLMPRYGSYRYVAKGRRSVVVFDSSSMEPGGRLRAVYVVSCSFHSAQTTCLKPCSDGLLVVQQR